jgi:hypothetical protein
MKGEFRTVKVLHSLAINVKLEFVGEAREPFDYDTLCSVALIQKGRYDGDARLAIHSICPISLKLLLYLRVTAPIRSTTPAFSLLLIYDLPVTR